MKQTDNREDTRPATLRGSVDLPKSFALQHTRLATENAGELSLGIALKCCGLAHAIEGVWELRHGRHRNADREIEAP